MQRICFTLQVIPEKLTEYRRRHQEVWPAMLDALTEAGWHNYSLFLREDGLLIGYLETANFDAAQRNMAAREVNARWQREMTPFFEQVQGLAPDEAMMPIEEIFHLP